MPDARHPLKRRTLIVGIAAASVAIAVFAAVCSVSRVSILPPQLKPGGLQTASATTHVLVDLPRSRIGDRRANWNYFDAVRTRTALVARLIPAAAALDQIARHAGVPAAQIAAVAPVTASVQSVLTEPGSEQRAREIVLARDRYRIEAHSRPDVPIIDIYAQAPSPGEAARLADATVAGLRDYLRALAVRAGVDPATQVRLQQLGPPRGGVINQGAGIKIAALTFLVAFALSFVALSALSRLLLGTPRATTGEDDASLQPAASVHRSRRGLTVSAIVPTALRGPRIPLPATGVAPALTREPLRLGVSVRTIATHGGDWPRTTRVLPWMLAVFMAMLWLVPFDSIQLAVSLPVDLKLDRLLLPFIVGTWALILIAGGRDAPRLRSSWIHVAVGAFVAVAFLSVVFDAHSLNQSLELDTSVKKLPLLLSYLSLFVVLASVVRRSEVRPFLTYTLVLAVICALGMLIEYRTQYNVFFEWSGKLLPGIFKVASFQSGYDFGGRRTTHGPTMHGLVAVAMLAMALPIAVVGIMEARRTRARVLYGLAACVLMAGMLATQRKSALVAPASAFVILGYFRRRELLRMTPIAAVLLVVLLLASPGTLVPVIDQFRPQALGANTVSDRASDYDAVRPDVFTHLALGRGYGSYQPIGHRILDSEVLVRLVETGVIGLVAFIMLGVAVVASARGTIASRHPTRGPPALMGAATAAVFLVTATLFDSMSYPQVPYIFLCFAALVAVLVKPPDG